MPQGTIKRIVAEKGFGFIKAQEGEFFFHHSSVQGAAFEELHVGQAVEFVETQGPKGPRADQVKLV